MNCIELLKDKVTIVITTFNRYSYLKRLLQFYHDYPLRCAIRVLDSSFVEMPNDPQLRYLIDQVHVKWVRFDPSIFICNKVDMGLKGIETKYSVLCADDDFLLPKGIFRSVQFLEKNPSYVSCQGTSYSHFKENDKDTDTDTEYTSCRLSGLRKSLSEKNSLDRLLLFLRDKYASYPFYAVHRSGMLIKTWNLASQFPKNNGYMEYLPSCFSVILGKSKIISCQYQSREPNTYAWYGDEDMGRMYTPESKKLFCNILLAEIEHHCQFSHDTIEPIFRKIYFAFEDLLYRKTLSRRRFSLTRACINLPFCLL